MVSQSYTLVVPFLVAFSWLNGTASAFVSNSLERYSVKNNARPVVLLSSNVNEGDVVLFSDSDESKDAPLSGSKKRWASLNPRVKSRIVKEAQERAIRNKKKREPAADKKRRMMMFYKEAQRKNKLNSRTNRPLALDDPMRVSLSSLEPGSYIEDTVGVVISLTNFGAYIDVGTECDGLLHVSQITRDEFIEHPREVFSPGDEIKEGTLRVVRVSPEMKKLQLSLLPDQETQMEDSSIYHGDDDDEDHITLDEVSVDDELWGEIKRVTSFGSYIELGAVVDGFLHFMDHPSFGDVKGAKPSEYMSVGDRVRVWVSDIDKEKNRIKLTAMRPPRLPGPRRE